jgi:hypothetical protein
LQRHLPNEKFFSDQHFQKLALTDGNRLKKGITKTERNLTNDFSEMFMERHDLKRRNRKLSVEDKTHEEK